MNPMYNKINGKYNVSEAKMVKWAQVIKWKGVPKYVIANVDDKFYNMSYSLV
jgi:uncharacterized protein YecE (DUF72 family)